MTYNIIATGSKGNAVIINDKICVDIGVPYLRLNEVFEHVKIVLLTHSHGDHFSAATARKIHQEHPAARFACCEWMVKPLLDAGVNKRAIDVVYDEATYTIGGKNITVCPEKIPHNVPNCAWNIFTAGERIFYATDCSTLAGIRAPNYDLYMIESNHTKEEIERRIAEKRTIGVYAYEVDAKRNHMSREQALEWLAANMGEKSKYVFLHQHKEGKDGICSGINAIT